MKKLHLLTVFLTALFMLVSGSASSSVVNGPVDVCVGFPASYNVPPTGIIYYWDITPGTSGNITFQNLNNIQVLWHTPGTETITVVFKDALGNFTTCVTTVDVHPVPNPDISYDTNPECMEDSSAQSGGPVGQGEGRVPCVKACDSSKATYTTPLTAGNTYTWTVTGGGTICSGLGTNSIQVKWEGTGGTVQVIEQNIWGCADSADICVELIDGPKADFIANDVCNGGTAYFTDQSLGGPPLFYDWNFGDPASGGSNTSADQNPNHIFSGPGTYTVTLIVMNDCYCRDTITKTVNVSADPGPDIVCPSTVCEKATATYSTSANCTVYNWTVTGGTITSGAGTSSIDVSWGAGPIGYVSLSVSGCSGGGICPTPTVVPIPIIPLAGSIAGPTVVCEFESEYYSVPCWGGVDYSWTVTGPGVISAGQGSHEIKVDWGPAGSGTVSVTYNNKLLECGGNASLNVDVKPSYGIFGLDKVCVGDNQFYSSNQPGPFDWYLQDASGTNVFTFPGAAFASITFTVAPGFYTLIATPSTTPNPYCLDTVTLNIEVVDVDTAMAVVGEQDICPGQPYSYVAQTNTPNVTLQWTIVNGTPATATGNPINVTWTPGAGPYQLSVAQVMNAAPNCTSDVITITVDSCTTPTPTISGTGFCVNQIGSFTFSTTGIPAKASFEWYLDDPTLGSITTGQGTNAVDIQWNSAIGSGNILVDISLCNQVITIGLPFTLTAATPATLTPSADLCPGVPITLTATGGYSFYSWSTGAMGPTTNSISVSSQGDYVVTVTDANGCEAVSSIFIKEEAAPTASLSSPGPLVYCNGDPINTTLYALESSPTYNYNWTSPLPSGLGVSSNTVTAAGTYSITVTNSFGCTATDNITVSSVPCPIPCPFPPCPGTNCQQANTADNVAFNSMNTAVCNEIVFLNNSTGASNFVWDFGDGTTLTQPSFVASTPHTYAEAGFYIVRLCGEVPALPSGTCTICREKPVLVPVAADFEVVEGCLNDPLNLTFFNDLSTTTPVTSIGGYSWSFPGGSPSSSALAAPPGVLYTTLGPHTATLTISDAAGTCTSTKNITFTLPAPPVANFSAGPACTNDPVAFTDLSTGGIIQWQWNFGDATSSNAQNPFHAYGTAGTYNVSLTVTNAKGCSDQITIPVNVVDPMFDTIQYFGSTDICQGETDTLYAPTAGPYLWSNGCTTPFIVVNQTGSYAVQVTDANGCTYTTPAVTVTVNPNPVAFIGSDDDGILCHTEFLELYTSVGAGYTYQWFNNGTFNGNTTPNQFVTNFNFFPGPDNNWSYTVVITDATGCTDTSAAFDIIGYTEILGSISPASSPAFCEGGSVDLTASAINGTAPYTYTWSNGTAGATTTALYDGLYNVTITDATGCEGVASFNVTVYPAPDICQVPTGCIELCLPDTVCGPTGEFPGYYTYEWLALDANCDPVGTAGTAQGLIVTAAGKYALVLTTPFGCTDTSDALTVEEIFPCDSNACFAAIDPAYTKILTDITITTHTVYEGKYYVGPNVRITVDGTTLDLTNVDMVYDICAGIDFINGAFVRSNNSVYRSCELDMGWRGWEFRSGSHGIINECTFKNAQRGLIFWGNDGATTDARVTNNLFENCKIAMLNVFNDFNESVTGNTFIIDGSTITYDFTGPNCITYLPYANINWGVYNFTADFNGLFSQNDFINSTDIPNGKQFHGVFINRGRAVISDNKFTNMYRSVDLSQATNSSVENNEIEITQQLNTIQHQIRGSLCNNVFVLSNEIKNTRETRNTTTARSAIYFDNSSTHLTIKENKIEGFANGIICSSVNTAYIGENHISNSNVYGIYISSSFLMDVACNYINMNAVNVTSLSPTGIGYFQLGTTTNLQNTFRSNCILETDIAMYFQGPPVNPVVPVLPKVVNNFLYNYENFGVQIIGFGGNIGSAASPYTSAGRNTFHSNNIPNGALDINSATYPITAVGNYGIFATSANVTQGSQNLYHSTASCGHQDEIDLVGVGEVQEIGADERCDPFTAIGPPILDLKGLDDDATLMNGYLEHFSQLALDERLSTAINVLEILSNNSDHSEMDAFYVAMNASVVLTGAQMKWMDYYYHFHKGSFSAAKAVLSSIQPSDQDETELIFIEQLLTELTVSGRDLADLTDSELEELNRIDERDGKYATVARDIIHATQGDHDHKFADLHKVLKPIGAAEGAFSMADQFLHVYPNPARDEVTIQYFIEDIDDASFALYNIEGKVIHDLAVEFNVSEIKLDINRLDSGIYLFVIENNSGVQQRAKIIKN